MNERRSERSGARSQILDLNIRVFDAFATPQLTQAFDEENVTMRQRFGATVSVVVLVVSIAVFPASRAGAQAVTLQEQLVAQYKVAKLASDTSGFAVTEEGTLLEIKKGGLLGVPYSGKTTLTNKYEG